MNRAQFYKPIFAPVLMFVMLLMVACSVQESADNASAEVDLSSQSQAVPVVGGGSYRTKIFL
jgi:hypothetical protein